MKWCMGEVSNCYDRETALVKCMSGLFIMTEWGLIVCLQKDDGSDSIAVQLADETHWNDLVIIIAVVRELCPA